MKSKPFPWREITVGLLVAILLLNIYIAYRVSIEPVHPRLGEEKPEAQPLLDDDPVKGNPDAPVTIVEFSDFQCPFCKRFFEETLPLIEEQYIKTGKVKFVYRDFPLGFHEYAQKAAEAAECADEQGRFWEYHDRLFQASDLSLQTLKKIAEEMGLDTQRFNECLDSGKYAQEVRKDMEDGRRMGVTGTPTFFINGRKIVGAQPFSVFQQAIEEALAQ